MTDKIIRKWTDVEQLLDEVFHDPDLAHKKQWRDRVLNAMPGCPENSPGGLFVMEASND